VISDNYYHIFLYKLDKQPPGHCSEKKPPSPGIRAHILNWLLP